MQYVFFFIFISLNKYIVFGFSCLNILLIIMTRLKSKFLCNYFHYAKYMFRILFCIMIIVLLGIKSRANIKLIFLITSKCSSLIKTFSTLPFNGTIFLFTDELCMFTNHYSCITWHFFEKFFIIFYKNATKIPL